MRETVKKQSLIYFKISFIYFYLKDRATEGETDIERLSLYWFISYMPTTTKVGPGQIQKHETI